MSVTPAKLDTPVSAPLLTTPQSVGSTHLDSSFTISSSPTTTLTSKRRTHRRTPIKNEPLSKLSSPSITVSLGKTPEEINAYYEQWMKLAADNKINASNSWNLGLIDYFADMHILKEGGSINFQKASCTLDGCVKIYTTRVDSVATEAEKLVGGLNDANESPDENEEEKTESLEKVSKRSRRAQVKTLEKDYSTITTVKYDLEFIVDPLFRKTCADFDEGGAKGLLFYHLEVYGQGQLIFDSSDATLHTETNLDAMEIDSEEKNEDHDEEDQEKMIDINDYSDVFQLNSKESQHLSILPALDNFVFGENVQNYEEAMQDMKLHLFDNVNEDDDIQVKPLSTSSSSSSSSLVSSSASNVHEEDAYVDFYVPGIGDYDDAHDDTPNSESLGDPLSSSTTMATTTHPTADSETADTVSTVSANPNEEDPFTFLPLPRAPASSSTQTKRSKPVRVPKKPKVPYFIDFVKGKPVHLQVILEPGGTSVNLPKTTERPSHRFQLPSQDTFSVSSLSFSFTRPAYPIVPVTANAKMISVFPFTSNGPGSSTSAHPSHPSLFPNASEQPPMLAHSNDDDVNEQVLEKELAADWAFEAPVHDDDDDDEGVATFPPVPTLHTDRSALPSEGEFSMPSSFDISSQLSTQFNTIATPNPSLSQPKTLFSSRLRHNFIKRAKQVDVKRLKETIWQCIRTDLHDTEAASLEDEPMEMSSEDPRDSIVSSSTRTSMPRTSLAGRGSETGPHPIDFQAVMQKVTSNYTDVQAKEISVPFCFVCLLHLANEKNLALEAKDDQSLWVYAS